MTKQTSDLNEDSDGRRIVIGSWRALHSVIVRTKYDDLVRPISTIKLSNEIDGVMAIHWVCLPCDSVIQGSQLSFNKRCRRDKPTGYSEVPGTDEASEAINMNPQTAYERVS